MVSPVAVGSVGLRDVDADARTEGSGARHVARLTEATLTIILLGASEPCRELAQPALAATAVFCLAHGVVVSAESLRGTVAVLFATSKARTKAPGSQFAVVRDTQPALAVKLFAAGMAVRERACSQNINNRTRQLGNADGF